MSRYEHEDDEYNTSEKIDNAFEHIVQNAFGDQDEEEGADRDRTSRNDDREEPGTGRGDTEEGEPGPEHRGPEPDPSGQDNADPGGGYAPSHGGDLASYEDDLAMMRAEIEHIDTVVMPHYELLISQAEAAGNGPRTLHALRTALEGARVSRGVSEEAITAVMASSEAVKAAYDNAGEEAATEKNYFHGDG